MLFNEWVPQLSSPRASASLSTTLSYDPNIILSTCLVLQVCQYRADVPKVYLTLHDEHLHPLSQLEQQLHEPHGPILNWFVVCLAWIDLWYWIVIAGLLWFACEEGKQQSGVERLSRYIYTSRRLTTHVYESPLLHTPNQVSQGFHWMYNCSSTLFRRSNQCSIGGPDDNVSTCFGTSNVTILSLSDGQCGNKIQ